MKSLLTLLALSLISLGSAIADEPTDLSEHLSAFQPLVGLTFKGEFADSTPEKPIFDVSRWERAMNGQAIRILHSVNDGLYGGETILMWDAKQQKIAYWYFTTAGFYTQGTMDVSGKKWTGVEDVTGNKDGITQVKSTSEFVDGNLIVKAEYLQNGKWVKGHEINYVKTPDAKVVFK